jgi:putative sigma-54 modulation protein
MNIQVKTVHFTADQKLIDFVNKKVSKLDTYFEGIIGVEVIMKVDKPETANNKIAEIILSIPGCDHLFAEKQSDSFEESLDLAIEAIRRQLTKFKEKQKDK